MTMTRFHSKKLKQHKLSVKSRSILWSAVGFVTNVFDFGFWFFFVTGSGVSFLIQSFYGSRFCLSVCPAATAAPTALVLRVAEK